MDGENLDRRNLPAPTVLAMVLCDEVHVDPSTHKRTILGTFSALSCAEFPDTLKFKVYVGATNGHGMTEILAIVADIEGSPVETLLGSDIEGFPVESRGLLSSFMLDFSDPNVYYEFEFEFAGVVVDGPGEFRIQLYSNGSHVVERRLTIVQA